MKKIFILHIFLIFTFYSNAQDLHFSQAIQSPLLLNPACAGVMDGWDRFSINQRNQWLGSTSQFMTSNFGADFNFFKKPRRNNAHLGMGLQFYNDVAGESKLTTQFGSLTLNGILPINNRDVLAVGIQGGMGIKSIDISRVTFESQWSNNQFGYDPTVLSGESNIASSSPITDVSTGIYYVRDNKESGFSRATDEKLQLGFSVYHVNEPKMKFKIGSSDRLLRKYVFHGSYLKEITDSKLSFEACAFYFIQGMHQQGTLGLILNNRFQSGTKVVGNSSDSHFGFGLYYRYADAIIPVINLEYKGFRLRTSYDIITSKMRKAGSGTIEVSLTYTNYHHKITKKRVGRF